MSCCKNQNEMTENQAGGFFKKRPINTTTTKPIHDPFSLHRTTSTGDKHHLIKLLSGAEQQFLNTGDKTGKTPLMHAILGEWIDCLKVLLKCNDIDLKVADLSGKTALHLACYKGNYKCMKLLLNSGANCRQVDNDELNVLHVSAMHSSAKCMSLVLKYLQPAEIDLQDKYKKTALHWSAYYGNLEPIKLLLKHESNLLIPDSQGKTPLHYAASAKSKEAVDCVKCLLEHQPSILNWQDYQGKTALHCAIVEANEDVVEILIGHSKCKISMMDNQFRTPLHWASVLGQIETIKKLLANNADLTVTDANGATALHYAAKNNHSECIETLLNGHDNRLSLNSRDEPDREGRTALIWAAGNGANEALLTLIGIGGDLNQTDKNGACAIHAAAQNGHRTTVKLLLAHGANKNATDLQKLTPLFRCCEYGHEQVLKVLYENGAKIECKDTDGRSALHWAALSGQAHVCSKLIKYGLNANIVDNSGRTPLQCASYSGYVSCMLVLLENLADIDWKDNEGMTALHWAASKGHLEAVKTLMDFGANLNQMEFTLDKYTPLDYALLQNHEKVAQYLLEQGALSIRGIMDLAAVKIQSVYRGYRLRKTFDERRRLMIQHEYKLRDKVKLGRNNYVKCLAALRIQKAWREHLEKRKSN